ncbi:MAG: outer membrane protein assembly factor BamD [Gammaproteobacteria bacterium]|jgi:outer membrane protein assembly factor BamD
MIRIILIVIFSYFLTACGPATDEIDPTLSMSVKQLYASARNELKKGNYQTAIEQFETLESRFPFGNYATQAQLDVAYTYYKYDEHEAAIAAAERFIKLNPRHKSVDYAYYLKGLVNFNRGGTILDKLQDRDMADYDRELLQNSYDDFKSLIIRFPESEYVEDSKQRILFLRNELARLDIKIVEYYASREAWVAVAQRTRFILENYQGTDVIKDALDYQLKAYTELKLDDLAEDTRRVIELNYSKNS